MSAKPDSREGKIEPKVRWLNGSMYLDTEKLAKSRSFREKVGKTRELEQAVRGGRKDRPANVD